MGAKVLAGSSSAEPGEPGAEPSDTDGDVHADVGDGRTAEGKRGEGVGGAAKAGSGKEIVPHFPHIGRVARYCEVPVSVFQGFGFRMFSKVLEGSRCLSHTMSLSAASDVLSCV